MQLSRGQLMLTERGESWLQNFEPSDRQIAADLAGVLSLVSHTEFERELSALIMKTASLVGGAVALYGARELPPAFSFDSENEHSNGAIDATPRGSDIGSEGRVASLIRNLCVRHPRKLLNHPTVEKLRSTHADLVLVVDDFIGSGKRCTDYLNAIWRSPSVTSWASYKRMSFMVAAYSSTATGTKRVRWHSCHPDVHIVRHCPTLDALHWKEARIKEAKKLCRHYADRAGLGRHVFGFQDSASLLVFEHGCPNNVPAIFWARSSKSRTWVPLFPAKRIDESVVSAFPAEIVHREPTHVLLEAGQKRLAAVLASGMHRPVHGSEALVLALFAKGKRRIETVASAAGLKAEEATRLVEACIAAGWISRQGRITDRGLAELRGMNTSRLLPSSTVPELGDDLYYPVALRDHSVG